jgi:hypothetical protein
MLRDNAVCVAVRHEWDGKKETVAGQTPLYALRGVCRLFLLE